MPHVGSPVTGASARSAGRTDISATAGRCLDRATRFAVDGQGGDGAWRVPSEPRVLENAVVACSLAGVRHAQAARARAVRWLARARPQEHDPFTRAVDEWLVAVVATGGGAAFTDLAAKDGPQARRTLYLHALACAAASPGADARRLLDQVARALAAGGGARRKPWQRALLLAFDTIARTALGLPVPVGHVEEFERAQSPDGSFYGMPLVTGMLHLALTRATPGHRVTLRARESLLADQRPDGTWRFLVSEVWDTGLLVRCLRGDRHFDRAALPPALAFLARAQNPDGGWPCTAVLDSDNDTTGNTLLALAGTPQAGRVRTAATRYARRHQTRDGLWNTWLTHDDTPAPDVVAHMVAGIGAAALPGLDLARARTWLTAHGADGHWPSDWYIPPAYGAAEISTTAHPHAPHRPTVDALLAAQRDDGGWPRIDGEPYSSPTATGLALTALATHGSSLPDVGGAIGQALRFLVETQTDDGTWTDRPVMSGPRPLLTATGTQIHALAARGLRDALALIRQEHPPC
ncbi:hypothetical protein GCM10023347_40280 [Streptomyces chumphonensis]|uniref:Uncharacterized protein n=1 Tax=Streptomyces chumphonensis TaxID=1214925 RepID=A0A927EW57_9ACTN|nr:prenyltransferase/squalene oxidase repeat-containing protein [Streptomyces chumphonensis]MBD3930455.1 hypothetical protein [Streptomyces chumphonensis]